VVTVKVPDPMPLVIERIAEAPVPPVVNTGVADDAGHVFIVPSLVPLNSLGGGTGGVVARDTDPARGSTPPGGGTISVTPAPVQSPDARILESTDAGFPAVRANTPDKATLASDTGTASLAVLNGIPDVGSAPNGLSFTVPRDAFVHTDGKAIVKLQARQVDGEPLPSWLMFDGITGVLNGRPPQGESVATLQLEVVARDDAGREARTTFTILGEGGARVVAAPTLASTIVGFPAARLSPRDLGLAGSQSTDMLVRFQPVADQAFAVGRGMSFSIPSDAFAHTNPRATVRLEAMLASGDPLPPWARFDGITGRLSGSPPDDFSGVLQIRVIARDNQGLEATTTFTITVGDQGALLNPLLRAPQVQPDAQESEAPGVQGQQDGDGDGDAVDPRNARKEGDKTSKADKQPAKRGAARFADQLRAAKEQSAGKPDDALVRALEGQKPAKRPTGGGRAKA
jgi:hypothetical protein